MSTAASLMTFAEFEQLRDIEGCKQELVNGVAGRAFVAEQDKVVLYRVTGAFRSEFSRVAISLADIFGAPDSQPI
jgi:hypothetical protein